ncbi:MAG: hypothetical protein HFJ50_04515 [Clostridia bacterium]|jgi:hypothetical protein|nr:hypothetical protein [Clostridia bacterium]
MEIKIKRKEVLINILIYLGLILIVLGNVLIQNIGNMDEIWVYNFGRCIVEGLIPYKDISMIITPLFPYICALFLKIFGNEIFVLRIVESIETGTILFMTYKIMQRLKMNKGVALLITLGISYIYKDMFCLDYNWAVLLIELILLYIELRNKDDMLKFSFKREFLLGILARKYNFTKTDFRTIFCIYLYIL